MMQAKKIMFVCGEASGDLLASELMTALKKQDQTLEFSGIVGATCEKQGIKSLVPLQEIAVMGITEIIPSIFRIKNAIHMAVQHIEAQKIDVLICVDAFAFTHRVAAKARAQNPDLKIIKYIPPKLWAWGAWRAKKLQSIYDLILASLPFEVDFFKQYNLDTEFVGHTVLERVPPFDREDQKIFIQKYNLDQSKKNILLLPGSRRAEIDTLLPIFLEVMAERPEHDYLLPVAEGRLDQVEGLLSEHHKIDNLKLIHNIDDRFQAFYLSYAALAASGTVSLELMMTHTPSIIAYKMSWLTAFLAKRLVNVRYASLLNIMLDKMVFPELLQDNCNKNNILKAFDGLCDGGIKYQDQLKHFEEGRDLLKISDTHMSSSDYAAQKVLNLIVPL